MARRLRVSDRAWWEDESSGELSCPFNTGHADRILKMAFNGVTRRIGSECGLRRPCAPRGGGVVVVTAQTESLKDRSALLAFPCFRQCSSNLAKIPALVAPLSGPGSSQDAAELAYWAPYDAEHASATQIKSPAVELSKPVIKTAAHISVAEFRLLNFEARSKIFGRRTNEQRKLHRPVA